MGRPDDRDEVHAGSWSFDRLAATVERLFGYPYTMPSHQGRGAEQVLLPEQMKRTGSGRPVSPATAAAVAAVLTERLVTVCRSGR